MRATQYLPDIVQLQQYLYKKCNCQFDRKDGKMTIAQLIKREKGTYVLFYYMHASAFCCLSVEGTRAQLKRMVISLSKAWELVHERLPEHGEQLV